MKLIKLINQYFNTKLQTSLELYIESKQPKNTADVENAAKDYFSKRNSGYFAG
jgi:hypothetical protein